MGKTILKYRLLSYKIFYLKKSKIKREQATGLKSMVCPSRLSLVSWTVKFAYSVTFCRLNM